jgi:predicted amidophosphoribosyltransferase
MGATSFCGLAFLGVVVLFLISRKRRDALPRCPHCLKAVEVDATRCPHCAGSFTAPLPSRAASTAEATPAPSDKGAFWVVIGIVVALMVIVAVAFVVSR